MLLKPSTHSLDSSIVWLCSQRWRKGRERERKGERGRKGEKEMDRVREIEKESEEVVEGRRGGGDWHICA